MIRTEMGGFEDTDAPALTTTGEERLRIAIAFILVVVIVVRVSVAAVCATRRAKVTKRGNATVASVARYTSHSMNSWTSQEKEGTYEHNK